MHIHHIIEDVWGSEGDLTSVLDQGEQSALYCSHFTLSAC
jgi:hypothetical protein